MQAQHETSVSRGNLEAMEYAPQHLHFKRQPPSNGSALHFSAANRYSKVRGSQDNMLESAIQHLSVASTQVAATSSFSKALSNSDKTWQIMPLLKFHWLWFKEQLIWCLHGLTVCHMNNSVLTADDCERCSNTSFGNCNLLNSSTNIMYQVSLPYINILTYIVNYKQCCKCNYGECWIQPNAPTKRNRNEFKIDIVQDSFCFTI